MAALIDLSALNFTDKELKPSYATVATSTTAKLEPMKVSTTATDTALPGPSLTQFSAPPGLESPVDTPVTPHHEQSAVYCVSLADAIAVEHACVAYQNTLAWSIWASAHWTPMWHSAAWPCMGNPSSERLLIIDDSDKCDTCSVASSSTVAVDEVSEDLTESICDTQMAGE